jgi:hypothetical protein
MTEADWQSCADPVRMLGAVRDWRKITERKARLFVVACCRRIWHLAADDRSRFAVEVGERFADGLASEDECEVAERAAREAANEPLMRMSSLMSSLEANTAPDDTPSDLSDRPDIVAADGARLIANALLIAATSPRSLEAKIPLLSSMRQLVPHFPRLCSLAVARARGCVEMFATDDPTESAAQAVLLREIVGNPFGSATVAPPAPTPLIRSLAHAAYDERHLPAGTLDPERLAILADALEDAGCTEVAILDHLRDPGPHVRGCWVIDQLIGRE